MYHLLFADEKGNLYDHPTLWALGRTGDWLVEPDYEEDFIPLPPGASLTLLPGTASIGMDGDGFALLDKVPWGRGRAVAVGALLPQGYTRTLLPSYRKEPGGKPLPLLGYAAVAWKDGQIYVAALPTDEDRKWNPAFYNTPELADLVRAKLERHPGNRVLGQLAKCALDYSCFTAQNIFYRRWEGGLPSSPACNARCLGCISLQPAECCPSPQERIGFQPTVEELAEIAVDHLEQGEEAIVSFGQGCEGEPSLQGELLSRVIARVRGLTARGTINMNTNAGYTKGIFSLCQAGLDSLRVSLISAQPEVYEAYYRPRGYTLDHVRRSLREAAEKGIYTSLNLLVMPGLTDREEEIQALAGLIQECRVKLLQLRNLNIDPDLLFRRLPKGQGEILGLPGFLARIRGLCPGLEIGNYTRSLR